MKLKHILITIGVILAILAVLAVTGVIGGEKIEKSYRR